MANILLTTNDLDKLLSKYRNIKPRIQLSSNNSVIYNTPTGAFVPSITSSTLTITTSGAGGGGNYVYNTGSTGPIWTSVTMPNILPGAYDLNLFDPIYKVKMPDGSEEEIKFSELKRMAALYLEQEQLADYFPQIKYTLDQLKTIIKLHREVK
jgi:hypothetical protein